MLDSNHISDSLAATEPHSQSHFADPSREYKHIFPAQMDTAGHCLRSRHSLSRRVSPRRLQPIVCLCGCQEVWHWVPLPSCPAWIAATTQGWLTHNPLSCVWPCCRMPAGSLLDSVLTSGSLCHTVSENHEWCISSRIYIYVGVALWFDCKYTLCCLSKQRGFSIT